MRELRHLFLVDNSLLKLLLYISKILTVKRVWLLNLQED